MNLAELFAKGKVLVDGALATSGCTVSVSADPRADLGASADPETLELAGSSASLRHARLQALVVVLGAGRADDLPQEVQVKPGDAKVVLSSDVDDVKEGDIVKVLSTLDPKMLHTRWTVYTWLDASAGVARVGIASPIRRGVTDSWSVSASVEVDLNGNDIAMDIRAAIVAVEVAAITRTFGRRLQTQIRKNAQTGYHAPGEGHIPGTGPGPNVATGDYLRSITLIESVNELGDPVETVTSNAEQAWRLEQGFVGQDALGRFFHQRAYPHWGPAIDTVESQYVAALETMAEGLGDRGFVGLL